MMAAPVAAAENNPASSPSAPSPISISLARRRDSASYTNKYYFNLAFLSKKS
jgi:hypothetical protein